MSIIRWDKTQKTWHTDVDKVGRYSVRRPGKRMPYQAYLNNKQIAVDPNPDAEIVKRMIETRIHTARHINKVTEASDGTSCH